MVGPATTRAFVAGVAWIGRALALDELGHVDQLEQALAADFEGRDVVLPFRQTIADGLRVLAGDLANLLDGQRRGIPRTEEVQEGHDDGHAPPPGPKPRKAQPKTGSAIAVIAARLTRIGTKVMFAAPFKIEGANAGRVTVPVTEPAFRSV